MKVTSLGVDPSSIIFANPSKMSSMVHFAKKAQVKKMTFDCESELHKISTIYPEAELLIRLATDDSHSRIRLSKKFGADYQECQHLLKLASSLKMRIVGVAFHAGCDCEDPTTYSRAIELGRRVFDYGKELGHNLTILDIGGGFSAFDSEKMNLRALASAIKDSIAQNFQNYPGLRVISEPGQYMVMPAYHSVLQIICKKLKPLPEGQSEKDGLRVYYLNDGCYGSFLEVLLNSFKPGLYPLEPAKGELFPSKIFGPTCTSTDTVCERIMLPDLSVGDYVVATRMGAYTTSMSPSEETFNGFLKPSTIYIFQ